MYLGMTAQKILRDLKKISTPLKAKASAWFFKTGKGQYGEGDVFMGVTVPEQRVIARKYAKLPLSEIEKLLKNKIHEARLTALLILVSQFEKASEVEQKKIVSWYLAHTRWINNWDLVDSSARYILGSYLLSKDRKLLYKLAKSKNIWERRIAIVATHAFILNGEYKDTFKIGEILFTDSHDLIHKAVGWMLRETDKRNLKELRVFLIKHAREMPRTALRYAIEHFSPEERKRFMLK